MTRVIEDLFGRADFNNLSCIKNCNAVGNICNNTEVMRDENDRVIEFFLQIFDELENLCLNGNVKRSGGLVADEDLRLAESAIAITIR